MKICEIFSSLNFNKIGETVYGIYGKVSTLLRKPGFIMVLIWLKIQILLDNFEWKSAMSDLKKICPNGLCRGIVFSHFVKNAWTQWPSQLCSLAVVGRSLKAIHGLTLGSRLHAFPKTGRKSKNRNFITTGFHSCGSGLKQIFFFHYFNPH
jgi:hypothetical protein